MSIVEGSSVFRRRLLDMVLALIIPPYAMRLSEYRRGVRQKALFLKRGMPSMIADRALPSARLVDMEDARGGRRAACGFSGRLRTARAVRHRPVAQARRRWLLSMTAPTITRRRSSSTAERERAMRFPVVGPHRDDIIITSQSRPASSALSRGLRRRTAMALMLAALGEREAQARARACSAIGRGRGGARPGGEGAALFDAPRARRTDICGRRRSLFRPAVHARSTG